MALGVDNASTPDVGKIERVIGRATKTGRVEPKGPKPIWATEIWWDTNPPDPDGIRPRKQARWLAESFYLLWKQGAQAVVWFLIRDLAPPPSFTSWSSGLYTADGEAKPALRAFRFPFVGDRIGKHEAKVWGIAPSKGRVRIERRKGKEWLRIGTARARGDRVFTEEVRAPKGSKLRARKAADASLAWKLK